MRAPLATSVLLPILALAAGLMLPPVAWAQGGEGAGSLPASVYITSILVNGLVRVAAIVGGIYIVWLGHNTMVRGIKGEFEFAGRFGKLKGSTPGLLFVLLGCLAIGWALQAKHEGSTSAPASGAPVTSQGRIIPPPMPK